LKSEDEEKTFMAGRRRMGVWVGCGKTPFKVERATAVERMAQMAL